MSIDATFRAIGAVLSAYAFGLLVTLTTTAALNAAAYKPSAICTADSACSLTAAHHVTPSTQADYPYSRAIHTAALFLAGE